MSLWDPEIRTLNHPLRDYARWSLHAGTITTVDAGHAGAVLMGLPRILCDRGAGGQHSGEDMTAGQDLPKSDSLLARSNRQAAHLAGPRAARLNGNRVHCGIDTRHSTPRLLGSRERQDPIE